MNATSDVSPATRARAELQHAVQANEEALAAGENPPFGQGALIVLRRRWEAAEAAD